jgi:hypothetical protein
VQVLTVQAAKENESREEPKGEEREEEDVLNGVRTVTNNGATHHRSTPFDQTTEVDTSDDLSPVALIDTAVITLIATDHPPVSIESISAHSDKTTPAMHINMFVNMLNGLSPHHAC